MSISKKHKRKNLSKPPHDCKDKEGKHFVDDEEFAERWRICKPVAQRIAKQSISKNYDEERAIADAMYGVWQAGRRDQFRPETPLPSYSRHWVKQTIRQEKRNDRNLIASPAYDLGWECPTASCENAHGLRLPDTVFKTKGAVKQDSLFSSGQRVCPLCGAALIKRRPPSIVSIDAPVHDEDGESTLEAVMAIPNDLPVEKRHIFLRVMEVFNEVAKSKREREIIEAMMKGYDPIDVAKGLKKDGKLIMDGDQPRQPGLNVSRQRIHQAFTQFRYRTMMELLKRCTREDIDAILGHTTVQNILESGRKQQERIKAKGMARKRRRMEEKMSQYEQARRERAERERPFFDTYGLPPISDTLPDIG